MTSDPSHGRRAAADSTMRVCTIVACNYLAQARVLARSFSETHPGQRLSVLVIDADRSGYTGAGEPFETITPSDLPLAASEFGLMATIYEAIELATAVKPWLLAHLLERGAEAAIYLDPDIEVFSSLDDLGRLAGEHGIVLMPHMRAPIPPDGHGPSQQDVEAAGRYNLGFIGVGRSTDEFLRWWMQHLRRDCMVAPDENLFVDQRVMDSAAEIFENFVVDDPTYNVAYWNLHERDVESVDGSYTVEGEPLRFFHYSGFDPRTPYLLSKHQGPSPRIVLSERPGVAALCRAYAQKLIDSGYAEDIVRPYGFGHTADGLAIDRRMRRLYRAAVVASEAGGHAPDLPDPFDAAQAADFRAWLAEPVVHTAPISRYLEFAWRERADLVSAFPDLLGADAQRFLDWLRTRGSRFDPPLPADFLPEARPEQPAPRVEPGGVNVAGYVRAELGVGEAARLLIAALRAGDIPYAVVPYAKTLNRQSSRFADSGTGDARFGVNVICVNADQLPVFARDVGPSFFRDRYTVGLWFWEVEEFPESMRRSADLVDEIWVASQHAAAAISPVVDRPVLVVPLPIVPPDPPELDRAELGLPAGFLFLFAFDFASVVERKNPFGLVDAFTRAFSPGEGPTLVLKTINGDRHVEALERLRAATAGRPDIRIIDGYFDEERQRALTNTCDAYVSLHRSEGFGLTMAEAMSLRKPVIATAYSGNLDFMTPWNSFLVPYRLVPIGPGNDPYPPEARWADPDLNAAVEALRRVYTDPEEARARAERGYLDVVEQRSPDAGARFFRRRLDEIERLRVTRAQARGASLGTATAGAYPTAIPAQRPVHRLLDRVWWTLPLAWRDALRPLIPERSEPPAVMAASSSPLGISDALVRAAAAVNAEPDPGIGRPLARPLQRTLFRILRVYQGYQRHAHFALLDAVQEVAQDLQDLSARHEAAAAARHELDEIAARVDQIEARTATLAHAAENVERATERLDDKIQHLISEVERLKASPQMDAERRSAAR